MMRFTGKWMAILLSLVMVIGLLGCGGSTEETTQAQTQTQVQTQTTVRVGSLKGPTSMGLVSLMNAVDQGEAEGSYEFLMETAADVIMAAMIKGDLDIALLPANVASILYNKTKGAVQIIDVNTLGVLYVVASDDQIQEMKDLAGKTIYLTGKGTSPDFVIRYLLKEYGVEDVTLEFKSEATEVVSALAADPTAIGLLPQPFATVACAQNENFKTVLDLTAAWDALQNDGGSRLVTGVTVVQKSFAEEHPDAVLLFIKEHEASTVFANENVDEAAQLVAQVGIIEKAAVAAKALPYCNIVCVTGEEMKSAVSGYLQVLYAQDPSSVGGALPADDFYFIGE